MFILFYRSHNISDFLNPNLIVFQCILCILPDNEIFGKRAQIAGINKENGCARGKLEERYIRGIIALALCIHTISLCRIVPPQLKPYHLLYRKITTELYTNLRANMSATLADAPEQSQASSLYIYAELIECGARRLH